MADAADSKSAHRKVVKVRLLSPAPLVLLPAILPPCFQIAPDEIPQCCNTPPFPNPDGDSIPVNIFANKLFRALVPVLAGLAFVGSVSAQDGKAFAMSGTPDPPLA